jgi:glycosyltransferase involved in cell wall biosynthesis
MWLTVIRPAKDEGHHIQKSAGRILASKNCPLELILVNDRSEDNTLEAMEQLALKDPRIKVVAAAETPDGWTGKTHVMVKAAEAASGELLLFTDADCSLKSHALCTAMNWFFE